VETDRSPSAPAGRRSYAFLTLPNYSQIALVNAIEPLRMANRVANRRLYDWQIVSLKGDPVTASSGLQLAPTLALADLGKVDILFVCGGIDVRETVSAPLAKALRRRADAGGALGALCTGGYILARAGLLNRYRATIHWENVHALREEFPLVELTSQVFTIDRDRYTCSGGTAPLDLMLNLIERQHGRHISHQVSEQFVVERVRDSQDAQYVPLRAQLGFTHQSLTKVAQLMEENIEKPLSLDAIARRTGLSTTWRSGCAARANCCCRRRCRSPRSRPLAVSSRRRTSRGATGSISDARRAPSGAGRAAIRRCRTRANSRRER
jgi:transcriptional regulator GlxA family with amidase domain